MRRSIRRKKREGEKEEERRDRGREGEEKAVVGNMWKGGEEVEGGVEKQEKRVEEENTASGWEGCRHKRGKQKSGERAREGVKMSVKKGKSEAWARDEMNMSER